MLLSNLPKIALETKAPYSLSLSSASIPPCFQLRSPTWTASIQSGP